MPLILPADVQFIIGALNKNGFRADIVGGPVRDYLMGRLPNDYDITTSATPDEIKAAFAGQRIVETGIKHGTVTLVLNGNNYEITTYRIDGEYKDSRRPESVEFTTDLTEDLARRDFTMNAIAYNPSDGFTDPWHGEDDIKAGIIRAVRGPTLRFTEDALRILRGLRFAATLGFTVEEDTRVALKATSHLLTNISAERIYTELTRLVSGDFAKSILTDYRDVISVFLPEIYSDTDISAAFLYPDALTRLSTMFYLSEGPGAEDCFDRVMRRLKTDTKTRVDGARALGCVAKYDTSDRVGLIRLLSDVGFASARLAVRIEASIGKCPMSSEEMLSELVKTNVPYRTADLDINGNDMMDVGIVGADIGRIMRKLLDMVMSGRIPNRRDDLITMAEELNRKTDV